MSAMLRCAHVPGLFSEGVEDMPAERPSRAMRRERVFAETRRQRARRIAKVARACLTPRRLTGLLPMLDLFLRDWIVDAAALPDPALALSRPGGLCGAARDLSPNRIIEAYTLGLHARAPAGPITWWAPARRQIVLPADGAIAADLHLDRDAAHVMALCARDALETRPLQAVSPQWLRAQARLADAGFIHAFSAGEAGGYGLALGRVFIMLGVHGARPALRVAFRAFEAELAARNFAMIDVSFVSETLAGVDLHVMERAAYNAMLAVNPDNGKPGRWRERALEQRPTPSPLLSLSQAMARAA